MRSEERKEELRGRPREPEVYAAGRFTNYAVYDPLGRKVGRVEKLFVDGGGEAKHVEVRMGIFRLRLVLVPVKGVTVDEQLQAVLLR